MNTTLQEVFRHQHTTEIKAALDIAVDQFQRRPFWILFTTAIDSRASFSTFQGRLQSPPNSNTLTDFTVIGRYKAV